MKIHEILNEDWNKVNRRDKTDGLSKKAVKAYRRENPGSKLQTAVTTKPSKLKPGSKAAKRRKSFCARMSGNKGPMKTPTGKPTPKALALRRWNCESIEDMAKMLAEGEEMLAEMKQRLDAKCWKGKHKEGTKIKGGVRVNNCVPNEGVAEGFFGIDDSIKGKIQNIVSDLSDIPGMWDHESQTFTLDGVDELKARLKKPKYVKYALNLTADDYEAEDIELEEKWSQKYKSSINCSNPKGFSQKAHCAGKNK